MEDRILKEKGDRDVASIKSLNLGNCKSSNVTGLSEDWKNLEHLNLSNVGLTTLKGFPRLPNLKKLELNGNNLSEGIDALACLPKLEELNLSGNKIKDVDTFVPLAQVSTLKTLNVEGCDICKEENYRDKMFSSIPSLIKIDGSNRKEEMEKKNGVAARNGLGESLSEGGASEDEDTDDEDTDDEIGDEEEEEDDDDDDDEPDIPLQALYDKLNEEDDEDFEANEEEDDDEDFDEDDEDEDTSVNVSQNNSEETEEVRGTKRKHEEDH